LQILPLVTFKPLPEASFIASFSSKILLLMLLNF